MATFSFKENKIRERLDSRFESTQIQIPTAMWSGLSFQLSSEEVI